MDYHQSARSTNVYKKQKKVLTARINQPLDNDLSTTIKDQIQRTVWQEVVFQTYFKDKL